jgi:transcriptional regulator with XRE-family HTH domain
VTTIPRDSANPHDVNAVVSFNIRELRQRRNWTQLDVAERLAVFTGHQLPQASISAMERGFNGRRPRRFDAHELYLLALVFEVPILTFFLPPIASGRGVLVSNGRPTAELYRVVLGAEDQLDDMDERLQRLTIENPAGADHLVIGREHYRSWRSRCLAAIMEGYGDDIDDAAGAIATFVSAIRHFRGTPTEAVTTAKRQAPSGPSRSGETGEGH